MGSANPKQVDEFGNFWPDPRPIRAGMSGEDFIATFHGFELVVTD